MAYPIKTREEAFRLYCDGLNEEEIAAAVGIKRVTTIKQWRAKYKWVKKKAELVRKTDEKIVEKKSRDIAAQAAAATDKHAKAADSLIGIVVFEINRIIEPMKRYVQAVKAAEAAGQDTSEITPPKPVEMGRVRKLTSSLKDAVFVERQALGLSTSSTEIDARVKKELFDFDRSKLPKKEQVRLDKLEADIDAILEENITAGDNLEDYAH